MTVLMTSLSLFLYEKFVTNFITLNFITARFVSWWLCRNVDTVIQYRIILTRDALIPLFFSKRVQLLADTE